MEMTPLITWTILLPTLLVIGIGVFLYHHVSEWIERKDQEIKTLQYQNHQLQEHIRTLASFAHPLHGNKMRY